MKIHLLLGAWILMIVVEGCTGLSCTVPEVFPDQTTRQYCIRPVYHENPFVPPHIYSHLFQETQPGIFELQGTYVSDGTSPAGVFATAGSAAALAIQIPKAGEVTVP